MEEKRKQAKKFLQSLRTVLEFENYLDSLVLKDEEKLIAKDIYIKGLSHTQIAMKYNISVEKSHKTIQRVLDKVL